MLKSVEFIKNYKNEFRIIGKIENSVISDAENELAVKFGEQLKEFLLNFGCISYKSIETLGLGVKQNSPLNLVRITKELRKHELPVNLIPFMDLDDGHYLVVDTHDIVFDFMLKQDKVKTLNKTLDEYLIETLKFL